MSISDKLWFRRTILSAAGVVLIALIAVPTLNLLGKPEPEVAPSSYLVELEKLDLPDDQNAASWLIAGAGAVVWSDEERATIGQASLRPYAEWPEKLRSQVRSILDRHKGALVTLHGATEIAESSFKMRYTEGIDMELPNLLSLIQAARLLACEARVAFADAEPEQGLQALASVSRMAGALAEESTLITSLISIAIERVMLVVAIEVTGHDAPWVDPGFLDDLAALAPCYTSQEMLQHVVLAYEAVVNDALKRGQRKWDSFEIPEELTPAEVRSYAATVEALLPLSFGADHDRFAPLLIDRDDDSAKDALASDLSGFATAIGRANVAEAQRQLLRAAIAMRKLGAENGRYPTQRPSIPELSRPDRFSGKLIKYSCGNDGRLTLRLAVAAEHYKKISISSTASMLIPATLPAP